MPNEEQEGQAQCQYTDSGWVGVHLESRKDRSGVSILNLGG